MRVTWHPDYYVPLPPNHRFPMRKFAALHHIVLADRLVRRSDIVRPDEAAWTDLRRVHTEQYLGDMAHGTLDARAVRRLGVPWLPRLCRRSRLAVRGTMLAAEYALEDGASGNLAGGTHHSFADHGEGFCVFNDVAVAVRALRAAGRIHRAVIVDLDVHQGNGNAAIFADDPLTYTFSMHGAKNYPFFKPPSTHDVPLPNHIGDREYLRVLRRQLPQALAGAKADIAFYLAGVDVVRGDRFGRLDMTRAGLHARDRFVLEQCRNRELPTVLLLSGGYARTPDLTADLHATVFREATRVFRRRPVAGPVAVVGV